MAPSRPLFEIYFENDRPITAAQVSEMLAILAKDFRRFRKRSELTVVYLETGSLRVLLGSLAATLAVAAETMAHANDVIDFGQHVSEVIKWAAERHEAPLKPRGVGVSSAKAILDIAIASKAHFKLSYHSPQGEQLYIEMDAPAASDARKVMQPAVQPKVLEAPRAIAVKSGQPRIDVGQITLNSPALPAHALDRLIQYREALPAGTRVADDQGFRTAIDLFVESLESSDKPSELDGIEAQLNAKGLHEIAAMIREARRGRDRFVGLPRDR